MPCNLQLMFPEGGGSRPCARTTGSGEPTGFCGVARDRRGAYGSFKGLRLGSAFQPIYSLAHHRAVGFEALLRAEDADGEPVPPFRAFALAEGEAEAVCLDRICRAVHVDNHFALGREDTWLFLNTDPRVVIPGPRYGSFFAELLAHYRLPAERVVVEILESAIADEGGLAEAVGYYRELGCVVAIDDFGAGHSNFDRLWRLGPDIVKLDRSVIQQAGVNPRARRMLPNLVSLVHEAGCLVLAEGVETEEEALLTLDSEVDLVQGFHFARPAPAAPQPDREHSGLARLCDDFRNRSSTSESTRQRLLAPFRLAFDHAAASLTAGVSLEDATFRLQGMAGVSRCYLLGADGNQVAHTRARKAAPDNPKFTPLNRADGSSWYRRRYFRRAVARPGQQYVSHPYLSITGVHLCVTLSQAIPVAEGLQVLCCDLDWDRLTGG